MAKEPLIKNNKTSLQIAEEIHELLNTIKKKGWDKFSKEVINQMGHRSRKQFSKDSGVCETVFYCKHPRCLSQFDVFFTIPKK